MYVMWILQIAFDVAVFIYVAAASIEAWRHRNG